jgi:predicted methyltransferase
MRNSMLILTGALAVALAGCATQQHSATAAGGPSASLVAAIADASRPDTDKQRDVNRKPAEVLAFAGVKPGDRVGELIAGRGYFTRIFCKAVGETGHVYTIGITPAQPRPGGPPRDMPAGPPPGAPPGAPPAAAQQGVPCANVTANSYKFSELTMPAGLDLVWTSENYHDLNNAMFGGADMRPFNKAVYDSLKPGGVYLVEDHAAAAGSGKSVTETLHRIEKSAVVADVTAVGFTLEGASAVLANPDDDHTKGPFALNGKSDKFLLKFRKKK